jgi:hypothetical protein
MLEAVPGSLGRNAQKSNFHQGKGFVDLSLSTELKNTIDLSCLGVEHGPLHTILRDERHNIYFSDEINHALTSLGPNGAVRWSLNKKGKNPGEFHYPKGIEIGQIQLNGIETPCVAVCDSWNARVQFFDRDGNFLAAWSEAGDGFFGEVVDIRFIGKNADPALQDSHWLALDRAHHSVFRLDPSGRLIFKTGRPFPDNLEPPWDALDVSSNSPTLTADCVRDRLPYDFLFMPLRIFGSAPEHLFIWEPKSRRLKQAVSENFLPVRIPLPPAADWIGADARGLLCFDPSAHQLGFYDLEQKYWRSARIEGMPIPSGRSSSEIWLQNGSQIHHYALS